VEIGEYDLPVLGPVHVVVDGITRPALPVYVPNPHAVVFVDDLEVAGELAVQRDHARVGSSCRGER
jgi:hypothetical protein